MKLKKYQSKISKEKLSKNKFTTHSMKITRLFNQFNDIVRWLSVGFVNQHPTTLLSELKKLTNRLTIILKNNGSLFTLKYIKECRRVLSQYLSGTKVTSQLVRLTYDGLPYMLGDIVKLVRGIDSVATLRVLYTFLTCTRSLRLGNKPDTNVITEKSRSLTRVFDFTQDNCKYLRTFWSALGYSPSRKVPKAVFWKEFHLTSKSGPTGHALKYSLHELFLLPYELVDDLTIVGGERLSTAITQLKSTSNEFRSEIVPFTTKRSYRKITSFPDKEDKVRIIAILDYWSQTVLKPLHTYLNNVLRRIKQDCTFDQAGFYTKIDKSEIFYSIDLTAATDRFPIDVIKFVLKGKFPHPYVEAWSRIMVGHPFDYLGVTLSYSVGNPMGAYSSWSSFAVAHHFVVYTCIKDLGLNFSDVPYCLLGDDIVIGHKDVAELYILKIRSLGVEINESKTHISKHFCEFAKRLIYKGQEITPFPYSSIKETSRRSYLLTGLLLDTIKKGWVPKESVPSCVSLFYEMIKKYNSRRRKVLFDMSQFTELIMTMTKDSAQPKELFHNFLGRYCHPTQSDYTQEESFDIFKRVIWRVACKSFEELHYKSTDSDNEPFGSLYTKQLLIIDSYKDRDLLSADLDYSSFPVYQVTEQLMNKLGLFSKEVQDRIEVKGSIKDLLKVITFPSDDRIFSQRSYHRTLSAASYISKLLKPSLDRIKESGIVIARIAKTKPNSMSSSDLFSMFKSLPKF